MVEKELNLIAGSNASGAPDDLHVTGGAVLQSQSRTFELNHDGNMVGRIHLLVNENALHVLGAVRCFNVRRLISR